MVPSHTVFSAKLHRSSEGITPPLGGVHGISIFVTKSIDSQCEVLEGYTSNCILWLKLSSQIIGTEFILGAIYIPHEGSRYHFNEIFDEICSDYLQILTEYNVPIMLIGDFNARTGLLDDFPIENDIILKETGLDFMNDIEFCSKTLLNSLNIKLNRSNQDTFVNNNGRKLIDMCRTLNVQLVNGRCGEDKTIGKMTCAQASTIDYVLGSTNLFQYISNFKIEEFDPLLSDKHCVVNVELSPLTNCDIQNGSEVSNVPKSTFIRAKWLEENKNVYMESFDLSKVIELKNEIESAESINQSLQQKDIDTIANKFKVIILEAAQKSGMTKEIRNKNLSSRKKNHKIWFNDDCRQSRAEYVKIKNAARKDSNLGQVAVKVAAKNYKRVLRSAKAQYNKLVQSKLRNLKSTNPRDYWKVLDVKNNWSASNIEVDIDSFKEHFKHLSQQSVVNNSSKDYQLNQGFQVKSSLQSHQEVLQSDVIQCNAQSENNLNKPVNLDEVIKSVKKLKNSKASGIDLILNEFLKNCPIHVLELATAFFNLVLDTGYTPSEWSMGVIKPLYKGKGQRNNADSYRGITLLSCLGKLFTSVLNTRINNYLDDNNLLGQEQAGFRRGYSTIDHIFVLHSLISIYQQQKKKLYVAFVDYKKAFDLVDRSSLWCKLLKHGINGKVLTVIKYMYEIAKSCVSVNNVKSDFFACNVGVRQGENLSPILFALYLNDFEEFISGQYNGLTNICNLANSVEVNRLIKLFTLLYADDTVVLAESAEELQKALNALKDYCDCWSLTVNAQKTKVMIFSRGKVRKLPKIYYNDTELEIALDYTYLGTKFNFNNKSKKAQNAQVNQASRALFSLSHKCYDLDLPLDIYNELFDQMITPILLYGSEVWGYEDTSIIENFHIKFCKKTLRVHKYTPNSMVLRELNRKKLSVKIENRMLNYWLKIAGDSDNKLTHLMYKLLRNMYDNGTFSSPWLHKIHTLLNSTGMTYLWHMNPNCIDKKWFKNIMKIKIDDISNQELESELKQNGQCVTYNFLHTDPTLPPYLTLLSRKSRLPITQIRCVNNRLPIIVGRHSNIVRHERFCTLCSSPDRQSLGDEYHYVMECSYFSLERQKFLKPHYYTKPSMFKMVQLFKSNNYSILLNLSMFCKIITEKFR